MAKPNGCKEHFWKEKGCEACSAANQKLKQNVSSNGEQFVIHEIFIKELHSLLGKYDAEISAEDQWTGYAECGQDVRMTVEFNDCSIEDIDLGSFVDKVGHGGE